MVQKKDNEIFSLVKICNRKLFSSIFYIRPNDFGGYINFGFHKESRDNMIQATEEQAMGTFHGSWRQVPLIDFIHLETEAKISCQIGHSGRKGSTQLGWEEMDAPLKDGNYFNKH